MSGESNCARTARLTNIGAAFWVHEKTAAQAVAEPAKGLDCAPVYLLRSDIPALITAGRVTRDSLMMADDRPYVLDLG